MTGGEERENAGVEGVLFDLDGTLIATKKLYLEAYARALEAHLGRRPTAREIMERKPRSETRFLRSMVPEEEAPECLERFYGFYSSLHRETFEGVYPGVPEMLARLREWGGPLGLVTGKSRRAFEITARHVDLGSFDVAVFDEDVPRGKPDPAGLYRALDGLGVPPGRTVYIGDAVSDARAARTAGVRPGAVLWPKGEERRKEFIRRVEPLGARIFRSPEEVTDFVTR